MLNTVQRYEEANFSTINNNMIDRAVKILEESIENSETQDKSMDIAIQQLKTIKDKNSTPVQDPLTVHVLDSLNHSRLEHENLSVAEQQKLLELTNDQMDKIRKVDERLKKDYLKKKVEIQEDSIQANDV